MYVCDFYKTQSVKGGYKRNSSVYITYADEEMVYQSTIVPRITGPLDRVRLSASGIIIRIIIFNNLPRIKKILSLQG
jgi:hypothetical protein